MSNRRFIYAVTLSPYHLEPLSLSSAWSRGPAFRKAVLRVLFSRGKAGRFLFFREHRRSWRWSTYMLVKGEACDSQVVFGTYVPRWSTSVVHPQGSSTPVPVRTDLLA